MFASFWALLHLKFGPMLQSNAGCHEPDCKWPSSIYGRDPHAENEMHVTTLDHELFLSSQDDHVGDVF